MTPPSNGDIDTLLQLADWSRAVQVLRYRFALLRRRLRRPGPARLQSSNSAATGRRPLPSQLFLKRRLDAPSELSSFGGPSIGDDRVSPCASPRLRASECGSPTDPLLRLRPRIVDCDGAPKSRRSLDSNCFQAWSHFALRSPFVLDATATS